MRHVLMGFAFSASILVAAQPSDETIKKELKSFQGKWQAVSAYDFEGKEQTNAEVELINMVVDGDKFTMKTGSLTINGTFTVDPTAKPTTIDVFLGNGKDNPMRGIYEVKDGTRRSCFAMPGKDRPDKFRKEKGFMSLEWRADK